MRENCGFIRSNGRPCGNPAGMRTKHPGQGCCHLHDAKPAPKPRALPREKCGFIKPDGRPCGNVAGIGTSHLGHGHCHLHDNARPSNRPTPRRQDPPNAPRLRCSGCGRQFVMYCPACDRPVALKAPGFWGALLRGDNAELKCTGCSWTGDSATCPHCSAVSHTKPAYRCQCCGATTRGRPGLCAACKAREQDLVAQGARQGVRAVQRCPVCTATVPAPCPNCGKPVVLERPDGINNAITGGALGMLMDSPERRFQKQNNYFQCRLCNWWGTEVRCPMCGKAIYARDW